MTSDGELLFYDVNKAPFRVYGLLWEDGTGFTRMPSDIAGKVSDGVFTLAKIQREAECAFPLIRRS